MVTRARIHLRAREATHGRLLSEPDASFHEGPVAVEYHPSQGCGEDYIQPGLEVGVDAEGVHRNACNEVDYVRPPLPAVFGEDVGGLEGGVALLGDGVVAVLVEGDEAVELLEMEVEVAAAVDPEAPLEVGEAHGFLGEGFKDLDPEVVGDRFEEVG